MGPIGVFDSGVGGITVLKALKASLPDENFLYLGDTARLPYGTKSPKTILRYLLQNIEFLMAHKVKAIVVACNSASSVLSEAPDFGIPVYGVINPGARCAYEHSKTRRIGILGTRTTVNSHVYVNALKALNEHVFTIQRACPLLVPLVEEGWEHKDVTRTIIESYVSDLHSDKIDTLILGCTHYPVLKPMFQAVLGSEVGLIDSADAIASELLKDMESGFVSSRPEKGGRVDVLATDDGVFFHGIASKLMSPFKIDSWAIADLRGPVSPNEN